MKHLYQFLVLTAFVLLGEAVRFLVPLPVPAGIWGLVLLFLALWTGVVKLGQVEGAAKFFLGILPVLFIVPAVGVMDVFADIQGALLAMIGVAMIVCIATMASTGYLADFMIWLKDRGVKGKTKVQKK